MGFVAVEPQLSWKLASEGWQRGLANRQQRKDRHFVVGACVAEISHELLHVVADIDEEGEMSTTDVNASFMNGKPQSIESVLVMKSPAEWDRFMRFSECTCCVAFPWPVLLHEKEKLIDQIHLIGRHFSGALWGGEWSGVHQGLNGALLENLVLCTEC